MAIIDTSISGSTIENRDQDIFIGIDLPFYKSNGSEGYFASTKITLHSVKNNLINLLKTEKGERYMQPSLGLNLKSLLFEPVTGDIENTVREDILSTLATWLPFVQIRELDVVVEGSGEFDRNKIKINLTFGLNQIPNMFESVQIEI
jgi:phage baseplate assembly protein W|tara:strand:- start:178 stop:618 length:441 start_codon:yes stop_codon:yes gene_type:complete